MDAVLGVLSLSWKDYSYLIPTSVTPVGNKTGSSKANCDFGLTVNTARVSRANLLTSFLNKWDKNKKSETIFIFLHASVGSQLQTTYIQYILFNFWLFFWQIRCSTAHRSLSQTTQSLQDSNTLCISTEKLKWKFRRVINHWRNHVVVFNWSPNLAV